MPAKHAKDAERKRDGKWSDAENQGDGRETNIPGVAGLRVLSRGSRAQLRICMNDVTRILNSVQQGNPKAADELLPLVYEELRKLAAVRMAREAAGQTLQATALVHEAWLRLTKDQDQKWDGRGHFFAAAAEAMRRILVERARGRRRLCHGGGQERADLAEVEVPVVVEDEKPLQVNEVLGELEVEDATQAQIVKMKFFMGMKVEEIATALGVSDKTVQRHWAHAKAWLFQRIRGGL